MIEILEDNPYPSLIFIDCESTGLHQPSHPIEIGVAKCDGWTQSYLVKPAHEWKLWHWDPKASQVHGIPKQDTEKYGKTPEWLACWLNNLCQSESTMVCSDNPAFEAYWLSILFKAAGIDPKFKIWDSYAAIGSVLPPNNREEVFKKLQASVKEDYPITHRASDDALYWAILYRRAATLGSSRDK